MKEIWKKTINRLWHSTARIVKRNKVDISAEISPKINIEIRLEAGDGGRRKEQINNTGSG